MRAERWVPPSPLRFSLFHLAKLHARERRVTASHRVLRQAKTDGPSDGVEADECNRGRRRTNRVSGRDWDEKTKLHLPRTDKDDGWDWAGAGRWRPRCQVNDDIAALMVQHCKVVFLSQELRAVKVHEPGVGAESRSPVDPGLLQTRVTGSCTVV